MPATVRHFETRKQAKTYLAERKKYGDHTLSIYKKLKGHLNRKKKPFVVCCYTQWLNLY